MQNVKNFELSEKFFFLEILFLSHNEIGGFKSSEMERSRVELYEKNMLEQFISKSIIILQNKNSKIFILSHIFIVVFYENEAPYLKNCN